MGWDDFFRGSLVETTRVLPDRDRLNGGPTFTRRREGDVQGKIKDGEGDSEGK